MLVVERAARHEVEGTKAEAMATKARKRAMMNFIIVLWIVCKLLWLVGTTARLDEDVRGLRAERHPRKSPCRHVFTRGLYISSPALVLFVASVHFPRVLAGVLQV